jgi:hypothetical protein
MLSREQGKCVKITVAQYGTCLCRLRRVHPMGRGSHSPGRSGKHNFARHTAVMEIFMSEKVCIGGNMDSGMASTLYGRA